jgi:hypothetical protein
MMGGPTPMSFGNMLIATMELAADVPLADPDNSFIYTLALESDGDSTNDWQYVDPYDNDTFQGTDRWYSLKWNHVQQRWSVEVIQVDANQQQNEELSSSVRIVVKGKNITFYISVEEIPGDPPKYRLVAFGHDGNYSPSHRGADTSTDPKASLPDVKK